MFREKDDREGDETDTRDELEDGGEGIGKG